MRPGGDYPGNSFGFRSLILCAILASVIRGLVGTSIAPTTDVAFVGTDLSSTPSTAPRQYGANGTDPDLRDIFLGRCADFKSLKVNPTADHAELKGKNCSHLWQLFSSSFMYREACDVDETMYQEFVEAATVTVPVDKATYWDGWDIYSTVRSYANEGKRSWTLEYSLVGYLINNLIFCGQEDPPGIRYDSCPTIEECGFAKGSANAFWAMASTYFGKQAKGQVRVFLNSNREGGAFQINESYFAQYELVNMPAAEVDAVNIYLVTDLEKQFG
ncbi:ADP-ribosyl cyclase/cyclic ADP-ribose hydrolase 2-like [Diadema antillarum]|uniref:ADP-ribosyl cyclase/cyclic ADP-ribose hydrolase 2-like n=1 Tax=Diadema antillarum TaxID=105358 RepID=UPI003A85C1F3